MKNFLDKAIETVSPKWGRDRAMARLQTQMVQNIAHGSGYGEYGASFERNALKNFPATGRSADEDIVDNIETLRSRSRSLFMGAPLATGIIKTIRTNVVGSGLMLNSQIDAKYLGLTEDQAREIEANIEREWRLWAETTNCDIERRHTFYQKQSLAFISALMSGDVFVTMPVLKRPGCVYDLRIGLIEADRVCDPQDNPIQHEADILGGVEVGKYGEPLAYWVAKYNPNSCPRKLSGYQNEWKRVLAYGTKTGRRNILHLMSDVERPAQRRGVPILAPVIESLKQLARYSDAELMAAVVSAMFTVFITTDTSGSPIAGNFLPGGPGGNKGRNVGLGNGSVVGLKPGEKIEIANPNRPNTAFEGFVSAVCKEIGAATELGYELVLKQFNSSYSASRAALLEAWKMFRMHREWLISNFCQPIYEEWLTEAVLKGRIEAPGFFDDPAIRAAWCGAEWFGDCQGQLDPLKEANAAKVRVEEGFSTREREAAELTGMKYDDIHAQRKREEDMRKVDGLTPGAAEPIPADPDNKNGEDDDDTGNE